MSGIIMYHKQLLIAIFVTMQSTAWGQIFHVIAPSMFRLGSKETIAIALEEKSSAVVNVLVQDYPDKIMNITRITATIHSAEEKILEIHIRPEDLPPYFLPMVSNMSVLLTIDSDNFHKEIKIPLLDKTQDVFIQTDKPIYTPKQTAYIRIIRLNEEALSSNKSFKLQIKNPNDIIIQETTLTIMKPTHFVTHHFNFPSFPDLGEWSATIKYEPEIERTATVYFELREYVLPLFIVELKTPEFILEFDENITLSVKARYVYGEEVRGTVTFRIGIKREGSEINYFLNVGPMKLKDGSYEQVVNTSEFSGQKDVGWFPEIEGSYLAVEVTVLDSATSVKEVVKDENGLFSRAPFVISFKRCYPDFKPGYLSFIEADIKYLNGKPAAKIATHITAMADHNAPLEIFEPSSVSDDKGKVSFILETQFHHTIISITLEIKDPRYVGRQVTGQFFQNRYLSSYNAFIAIERGSFLKLQIGERFVRAIYIENSQIRSLYYAVVSKRKIIRFRKLRTSNLKMKLIHFQITPDMAPSFRLVVWTQFRDELLADSIYINVGDTCPSEAEVIIEPKFEKKEPGEVGMIHFRGTESTSVGILVMDKAVYTLSEKDNFARTKLFKDLEDSDLGCGPGGGATTDAVLGNAGVIIITKQYVPKSELSYCAPHKSRKREAPPEIKTERNFHNMKEVVQDALKTISIHEENRQEYSTISREDFRETADFDHFIFGRDGENQFELHLPHSMTTWIVQAVSISRNHEIRVLEPISIVSMKKIFLQIHLPYSVVRNEPLEIQATVFNYGGTRVRAVVYMYGVKGLCTGVMEGEKSEKKTVFVEKHSAATVTFNIIPIILGNFKVRFVALTSEGNDVIVKKLNVRAEGQPVEINFSVTLDPSNQRGRVQKCNFTPRFTDSIEESRNLQLNTIDLTIVQDIVPGSKSCIITALGDPSFETTINKLDKFLQRPRGPADPLMTYLSSNVYAMKFLKEKNKMTPEIKRKGLMFTVTGYKQLLLFRKIDGSYSTFTTRPSSTWLTASCAKVLCQAREFIRIDDHIISSSIKWLLDHQNSDGSFIEGTPLYHTEMMGGVNERISFTAFVLVILQECQCDIQNLQLGKIRALTFLEDHLDDINEPLPVAITAYALSLSDSKFKEEVNNKLMSISKFDEGTNSIHWEKNISSKDIEATSYALLNQLLLRETEKSRSIYNWLKKQQFNPGSFSSIQDTIIGLQALSKMPAINLFTTITFDQNRSFKKVLQFDDKNSHVLQSIHIKNIGEVMKLNTSGNGVAFLNLKLRYNIFNTSKTVCKFDISVNVTELEKTVLASQVADLKEKEHLKSSNNDPKNETAAEFAVKRAKRQEAKDVIKFKFKIAICVRYLGNNDAGKSVVDLGIFSGFLPNEDGIKELQNDPKHKIEKYEVSSKGVVFYLKKVPTKENYCFQFHIFKYYDVEGIQRRMVKVYDYYKPDETCAVFYSPTKNSESYRTTCDDKVCECAKNKCPSKKPFESMDLICNNYDYVWKGKFLSEDKEEGFLKLGFIIDNVFKEGVEEKIILEQAFRYLLVEEDCLSILHERTYLIMGRDGYKHEGSRRYRYLLDRMSAVYLWNNENEIGNEARLQLNLTEIMQQIERNGCSE